MNLSSRLRQGTSIVATLSLALMSLAFALVGTSAAQAAAHTATTRYVSNTVAASTDASCSAPGYATIQAAVTAAVSGDTVYVCGTTPYTEEVIITGKSLTLTGDAGAILKPPASPVASPLPAKFATDHLFIPSTVLFIWGSTTNVTIKGLTVSGPMPTNNSCADEEYGVLVLDGATVAMSGTTVENVYDSSSALYGCQYGVGVEIGREYWPTASGFNFLDEDFVGHATITGVTVKDSQKGNIVIDGKGTSGTVTDSTITGFGRSNAFASTIAFNGVQFSRGAGGSLTNSTISGMNYQGSAAASGSGVIVFGGCGDGNTSNVQIINNTLTNNDVGVDSENYDSNTNCTTVASSPSNTVICGNTITNDDVSNVGATTVLGNPYHGYQAGILEIGNQDTVIDNAISGTGYATQHNSPSGPYVIAIDTTSLGASIKLNQPVAAVCGSSATSNQAFVRLVDSSSSASYPSADLALDKSSVVSDVAACSASDYVPVASGSHTVTIFSPTGGSSVATLPSTAFAAGTYYTIVLVADPPSVLPAIVVFTDDLSITPNQAKVRVYHLSDTSGPLTVTQGANTLTTNLTFEHATSYDTVAPGTVTFDLKENNPPNTNVADALALSANKVYSIFWMCGKAVNTSTAGIPSGLPNGGGLSTSAPNVWLFLGLALVLLIGLAATLRIVLSRRVKQA